MVSAETTNLASYSQLTYIVSLLAPHLPVHLGSMSFAVRYQVENLHEAGEGPLEEGDVILTNHPVAGGSHLPDMTIITPCYSPEPNPKTGKKEVIFYTASRAHHADIGGIAPGSMPPNSRTIFDEGAQIVSFKICKRGKFDYNGLIRLLVDEPAKYPNSSGSRCVRDVVSDMQAQIAANNKGIALIHALIEEYDHETVTRYMYHVRDNCEAAVRSLLRRAAKENQGKKLKAIDHMDDGTPIQLEVTINEEEGSAVFDFEGTGPAVLGNVSVARCSLWPNGDPIAHSRSSTVQHPSSTAPSSTAYELSLTWTSHSIKVVSSRSRSRSHRIACWIRILRRRLSVET